MLLDKLLSFAFKSGDITSSISDFKKLIKALTNLRITLDPDLLIALILRQLPEEFKPLCTNLRHRESLDFDTAIEAIEAEGRAIASAKSEPNNNHALVATSSAACKHCGKVGHSIAGCWLLHPELAPVCDKCNSKGHWSSRCRRKAPALNANFAVFEDFNESETPFNI